MPVRTSRALLCTVALTVAAAACSPPMLRRGPLAPEAAPGTPISQLWIEPNDLPDRNLLTGPANPSLTPAPERTYTVVARDNSGYSRGYDVTDIDGRAWDIKVGEEAQSEVVVSRILWALGYHQPPTYYATGWKLAGTWDLEGQPARFRLESGHEADGEWSWQENPFVGTRALHGLIAVNLILNNWDFKTSNNRVYKMLDLGAEPSRRYVVQDLGAALGKSRTFPFGTRNNIEDFEKTFLIKAVEGDTVLLDHRSYHRDILERLSIADVVWACELMNRLSDAQLDDAFSAAAYPPEIRKRFITKIRAKIGEGLALRRADAASRARR
jgi:hypothetical protein